MKKSKKDKIYTLRHIVVSQTTLPVLIKASVCVTQQTVHTDNNYVQHLGILFEQATMVQMLITSE